MARGLAAGLAIAAFAIETGALQQSPRVGTPALRIERVFGPEVPTGRYKHPASITDLRNGDLYLVYYGGAGEYATETAVFGARLQKGASTWSAPQAIARDPFRSLGNAVVWEAPDGVVWLFYVVRYGDTWAEIAAKFNVSPEHLRKWNLNVPKAFKAGQTYDNVHTAKNKGGEVRGQLQP